MVPQLRRRYNETYSDVRYRRYASDLAARCGAEVDFALAETPVFLNADLADRCAKAAAEIVHQLGKPQCLERVRDLLAQMPSAPPELPPGQTLPQFAAVDFAIARASDGALVPRLVELQGFPSLFGFELAQHDAWVATLAEPFGERRWSSFFCGNDRASCEALVRSAIAGGGDADETILLDVEPRRQKTHCDFSATERIFGVAACDPRELSIRNRRVYRRDPAGRERRVARIFNRVVGDDFGAVPSGLLSEDLEVTWAPHPAWFWLWSKAALPFLSHLDAPRTRLLGDLERVPERLSDYVLKPLFSYAGSGVNVSPGRADVDAIPHAQRRGWCLQEKIAYAQALEAADGAGVKVELRVMLARPDDASMLVPAINLCRLSRGEMHGVDHNKGMTWVGSSIALWEVP